MWLLSLKTVCVECVQNEATRKTATFATTIALRHFRKQAICVNSEDRPPLLRPTLSSPGRGNRFDLRHEPAARRFTSGAE